MFSSRIKSFYERCCLVLICSAAQYASGGAAASPPTFVPCCNAGATAAAPAASTSKYLEKIDELYLSPTGAEQQTITLKLVCVPGDTACKGYPSYPLAEGERFKVLATSDHDLPVALNLVATGDATVVAIPGQPNAYLVHLTSPAGVGKLTLHATQPGAGGVDVAPAVKLVLTASSTEAKTPRECAAFSMPMAEEEHPRLDAAAVVSLIGSPDPFALLPQGKYRVLIYSRHHPLSTADQGILTKILQIIDQLKAKTPAELGIQPVPSQFMVELSIPHATALGDLAKRISSLSYSQFTAQDVGSGKIRITSSSTPKCEDWRAFLSDLRGIIWQVHSEPSAVKLFYLNAPDVTTALNAGNGGGGGGQASGAGNASQNGQAGASGAANGSPSSSSPSTGSSQPSTTTAVTVSGTAAATTTVTTSMTNPSASASSTTPGGGTSTTSAPTPTGASGAPSGAPGGTSGGSPQMPATIAPVGTDWLVLSDTMPGDDALIAEKRRVIAALDIPRPEMFVSAWVLQDSSTDGQSVGNFNDIVHRTVSQNNEALQSAIVDAWSYLKHEMENEAYFDDTFYRYVVNRYIADLPFDSQRAGGTQDSAQDVLNSRSSVIFNRNPPVEASLREKFGFCGPNEYCLGYVNLFHPLKPRLTDMLLAVIASRYPMCFANHAAQRMEDSPTSLQNACDEATEKDLQSGLNPEDQQAEVANHSAEVCTGPGHPGSDFQRKLCSKLALDNKSLSTRGCEDSDLAELIASASPGQDVKIRLSCFRKVASQSLKTESVRSDPSSLGLVRAAVADFLFNYKISQQYPHEFSPYELGRSADTLNSALRPLVDAFYQDVIALQTFLGAELQVEVEAFNAQHHSWVRNKPTFLNNGLVTVRTISGQESTVDAVSQNFLDASSAPQISQLANSILGASTPSSSSSTPVGDLLKNLSPNQAQLIIGALGAYQTSKIQIGRELSIDVTPRSLNGAASAEITATLKASEPNAPNYYGGSQNGDAADLSRVATHNTSTRIRVDSIKIFDISSFTAVLQRDRSRFPLLPPFVEIPYIGTILGIPLPPSTEYHSSTALLSAFIVPTAADLAAGLAFRKDQIVDPAEVDSCVWPGDPNPEPQKPMCSIEAATALGDLNNAPILEFHRAKIQCLATNGQAANWMFDGNPNKSCDALSFDDVLHTAP